MGTVGILDAAEETLARSAAYRLLSQAMAYPTGASVAQLLEEDLAIAERLAELMPAPVRAALEETGEALRAARPGSLEGAYAGAFSHVHSADCSAFENDYAEGDVWRRSHQMADIAGFYRAFGVTHPSERPDHVAVELEFLHLVSCKVAWALACGDTEHAEISAKAEERFLEDHVLRWMPGFAARLSRVPEAGPYQAVAGLLTAVLEAEAERIGARPDASGMISEPEPEPEPDGVAACEDDG